jgi:hypothetical protein
MLWIENIVESTSTLPFLTNSRVDMASFVHPHKGIARRNTFSTLPSAQNGGELEGEVESGRLKCHFTSGRGFGFTKVL